MDALGAVGGPHARYDPNGHTTSFALIQNGHQPRFRGDINKHAVEAAKLFISYLEDRGVLPCLPVKPEPPLVAEFTAWAREQHGLAETTLGTYRGAILPFFEVLGEDPAAYDATAIRAYMLGRAGAVSVARPKGIGVAIRAFLRFLIATGRPSPRRTRPPTRSIPRCGGHGHALRQQRTLHNVEIDADGTGLMASLEAGYPIPLLINRPVDFIPTRWTFLLEARCPNI